jgi:REP element-mobilizing transposase RayT
VHTVFSTKERRPWLREAALRQELHSYHGVILKHLDCQPIIVGGVEDPVHLLAGLARTCTAAERVKEVKRGSSLWAKQRDVRLREIRRAIRVGLTAANGQTIQPFQG